MQRKEFVGDSGQSGCGQLIYHVFVFFLSGMLAYNLVEPQSFLGVLGFLILWPFVQVGVMLMAALVFGLAGLIFMKK